MKDNLFYINLYSCYIFLKVHIFPFAYLLSFNKKAFILFWKLLHYRHFNTDFYFFCRFSSKSENVLDMIVNQFKFYLMFYYHLFKISLIKRKYMSGRDKGLRNRYLFKKKKNQMYSTMMIWLTCADPICPGRLKKSYVKNAIFFQ